MELNEEELKYSQTIRTLKSLSKVKAPQNFESDLMRRINSASFQEEEKSFWDKIIIPSKLIPSAVAATAVILFFLVNAEPEEFENPLLITPRIREDVTTSATQIIQVPLADKVEEKLLKKESSRRQVKKDKAESKYYTDIKIPEPKGIDKKSSIKILPPEPIGFVRLDSISSPQLTSWMGNDSFFTQDVEVSGNYPLIKSSSGEIYQVSKSGLNFRQVNLVEEEKQQMMRLKEKFKNMINETGKALKIK